MAAEIDPMVTDMFIQCRNVLSLAALQNRNQIKQLKVRYASLQQTARQVVVQAGGSRQPVETILVAL